MDNKKCAHPSCTCRTPEGQSYCSKSCESAKDVTDITCQCQHPDCQGTQLRP